MAIAPAARIVTAKEALPPPRRPTHDPYAEHQTCHYGNEFDQRCRAGVIQVQCGDRGSLAVIFVQPALIMQFSPDAGLCGGAGDFLSVVMKIGFHIKISSFERMDGT